MATNTLFDYAFIFYIKFFLNAIVFLFIIIILLQMVIIKQRYAIDHCGHHEY